MWPCYSRSCKCLTLLVESIGFSLGRRLKRQKWVLPGTIRLSSFILRPHSLWLRLFLLQCASAGIRPDKRSNLWNHVMLILSLHSDLRWKLFLALTLWCVLLALYSAKWSKRVLIWCTAARKSWRVLILHSWCLPAKAKVFSCMVSLHASTSPNCIQLQWPPAGHCSGLSATTVKLSVQPSWRIRLLSKIGRPSDCCVLRCQFLNSLGTQTMSLIHSKHPKTPNQHD